MASDLDDMCHFQSLIVALREMMTLYKLILNTAVWIGVMSNTCFDLWAALASLLLVFAVVLVDRVEGPDVHRTINICMTCVQSLLVE